MLLVSTLFLIEAYQQVKIVPPVSLQEFINYLYFHDFYFSYKICYNSHYKHSFNTYWRSHLLVKRGVYNNFSLRYSGTKWNTSKLLRFITNYNFTFIYSGTIHPFYNTHSNLSLNNIIKIKRESLGISQEQLFGICSVNNITIPSYRVETGKVKYLL